MVDSTPIAIDRARARETGRAMTWLVNLLWPGLGNLLVGQTRLAVLFGLVHWGCVGLTILMFGIGGMACVMSWAVASVVGHVRIGRNDTIEPTAIPRGAIPR